MINLAAVPPLSLTTDVLALMRRRMAKGRIIPAFFVFGDGVLPTKAERAIFIFAISLRSKENRRRYCGGFQVQAARLGKAWAIRLDRLLGRNLDGLGLGSGRPCGNGRLAGRHIACADVDVQRYVVEGALLNGLRQALLG